MERTVRRIHRLILGFKGLRTITPCGVLIMSKGAKRKKVLVGGGKGAFCVHPTLKIRQEFQSYTPNATETPILEKCYANCNANLITQTSSLCNYWYCL